MTPPALVNLRQILFLSEVYLNNNGKASPCQDCFALLRLTGRIRFCTSVCRRIPLFQDPTEVNAPSGLHHIQPGFAGPPFPQGEHFDTPTPENQTRIKDVITAEIHKKVLMLTYLPDGSCSDHMVFRREDPVYSQRSHHNNYKERSNA